MKQLLTLSLIFSNIIIISGQELLVPSNYKILHEVTGDLNKDGIDEKVIVYNITQIDSIVLNIAREIQILKSRKGVWKLWKKSRNPILEGYSSEYIHILNGILSITHSSDPTGLEKWTYTDQYRFQNNEFELISHDSFYGYLNDYLLHWNFDVMTGKIECKKEFIRNGYETYKTEKETFYIKNIKINLNDRNIRTDIKILSPKYKIKLYL